MGVDDIVPAVVMTVDQEAMHVRFGQHRARVVPKGLRMLPSGEMVGIRGIGRKPADQLVRPGDLIEVKITTLETARYRRQQSWTNLRWKPTSTRSR